MTSYDNLYRIALREQQDRIGTVRRENLVRGLRPNRRGALSGLGGPYAVFLLGMLASVLVMLAAFLV